ncbi:MAG: hypothetical protein HN657_00035 [Candidatus Marinimicrobia bacterium]|nr:hypothetical protein [Candidatus Neomarinimicrobiota bacterium]MBT7512587.1 hypothetical protein [Candidatus Neomarinimicrobiota bacterium]
MSNVFFLGSIAIVSWWIFDGGVIDILLTWRTQADSFSIHWLDIIQAHWQRILAVYLFICFQTAGIAEMRMGQDYLKAVIVSIILTPFGLFFFKKESLK